MDIKGFVERAKDAATAATEKAKVVAASAAEQARDALGSTSTTSAQEPSAGELARSFATVTAEKLAEFKDLGSEKLQLLIGSFQQALPAIQMAGYELTEFEVELGMTPKLIPHFRHVAKCPDDVDRARALVRENRLGTLLLSGLLKAGAVQKQIKVAGFGFSHIEIELGLIPAVRLQYKNDWEASAKPIADVPLLVVSTEITDDLHLANATDDPNPS